MNTLTAETYQSLHRLLTLYNAMTLAYTDTEGPGACALWFAPTDDLDLIFLSSPRTRHGTALFNGGNVAFTMQKDEQHWQSIRGVQGSGFCSCIPQEHMESAWKTYSGRFPFVVQPFGTIAAALAKVTLWSVHIIHLRVIDNSKGFGHKDEYQFKDMTTG
jgi:uncharacterized protein